MLRIEWAKGHKVVRMEIYTCYSEGPSGEEVFRNLVYHVALLDQAGYPPTLGLRAMQRIIGCKPQPNHASLVHDWETDQWEYRTPTGRVLRLEDLGIKIEFGHPSQAFFEQLMRYLFGAEAGDKVLAYLRRTRADALPYPWWVGEDEFEFPGTGLKIRARHPLFPYWVSQNDE